MNNFKKQFKQGDDYCDIRADYRSLISIGKSVEETEDLLLRAYCPKEVELFREEDRKSCFFYSGRRGLERIESSCAFPCFFRQLEWTGF